MAAVRYRNIVFQEIKVARYRLIMNGYDIIIVVVVNVGIWQQHRKCNKIRRHPHQRAMIIEKMPPVCEVNINGCVLE